MCVACAGFFVLEIKLKFKTLNRSDLFCLILPEQLRD